MKSKAHIKSHPLHPILIPFPIAFLTGALLFDVLGWAFDKEDLWRTGMHLEIAGIAFALLAAVPGIIDYLYTVPPDSTAKTRATKHGIINIINVIIFSIALLYRQRTEASPFVVVGLETIGVVLICIAGWMGATLVHRNQIGVDIRYADAGKWKEEYFDEVNASTAVADKEELKVNQMKLIHVKDKRIVIGRTENGYVAFDDRCTHRGGSLAGGALICGTVQCPWHGSQFDTATGALKAGPAKEKISTYPVTESDGKIYIRMQV